MRQPVHQNPLLRVLAAVAAVLVTALAVFIGAMAFLAFLGLAIIGFVAFQLRLWWIRRRFAASRRRQGREKASRSSSGRIIEGEYRRNNDD